MSGFDPNKPTWDVSQPGPLPDELADAVDKSKRLATEQEAGFEALNALSDDERLNRLDEMQAEAVNLANSRGAEMMTDEQRFINTWTREATVAAASLHVFQTPSNQVEDREAKITDCVRRMAVAFYKLGKIPDALMMAAQFPDLVSTIERIQLAVYADDSDLQTHSCQRPQGEQDGKSIETDRRWDTEQIISVFHGCLVHVWECVVCHRLNATPDTPERQARYTASMHATIHAAAKGDRPNVKGIAGTVRQFEAGTLLTVRD